MSELPLLTLRQTPVPSVWRAQHTNSWIIRTQTGPALFCPVLHCPTLSFPPPCLVLLTMPGPVWSCPALLNTDLLTHCPTLLGLTWYCLVLLCFTLPGAVLPNTARPWPALHEPARFRSTLPILTWSTQPGSTLSRLAVDCLTLPFLPLSCSTDHARSCAALSGTARSFMTPPGPVRRCPTLLGTSRPCPNLSCAAPPGPALPIPVRLCPALSGLVWSWPICINYFSCLFSVMHCVNPNCTALSIRATMAISGVAFLSQTLNDMEISTPQSQEHVDSK